MGPHALPVRLHHLRSKPKASALVRDMHSTIEGWIQETASACTPGGSAASIWVFQGAKAAAVTVTGWLAPRCSSTTLPAGMRRALR